MDPCKVIYEVNREAQCLEYLHLVQIPTWLNEEPEWYNKQPAILKKAPSWYYTPPHWYNSPPTPMPPGTAVTHKTQASQVDQIIKRQE